MKNKTEFAESAIAKSLINNLKRGKLFRNEKYLLSVCHCLSDNIGNSLALTRTGRAFKQEATAVGRKQYCVLLA